MEREQTVLTREELILLYRARVEKGVALLNKKVPNWREAFRNFKKTDFSLGLGEFCVLGQLGNAIVNKELRVEIPRDVLVDDYKPNPYTGRIGWDLGLELLGFAGGYVLDAWLFGFDKAESDYYTAMDILQELWEAEIWGR